MQLGLEEGFVLFLLFFCVFDSFSFSSLGDFFFYKVFLEQIGEMFFLNNLEGIVLVNQCSVDEVFCSSLLEENLIKKEMFLVLVKGVEEFEFFCEVYWQFLEKLEEKMES